MGVIKVKSKCTLVTLTCLTRLRSLPIVTTYKSEVFFAGDRMLQRETMLELTRGEVT